MMNALSRRMFLAKLKELASVDARALGVMRIGLSAVILYDLANRSRAFIAHYTNQGILTGLLPQRGWLDGPVSIHLLSGAPFFQALLFLLAALFAVLMLIGYRTRIVTVLSWFLLVSLQAAVPSVLFGGDIELAVLLFFAMFVPWGIRYSFDAHYQPAGTTPATIASVATLALLLQVSFIYLFAVLSKSGAAWHGGSAVYYVLSNHISGYAYLRLLLSYPSFLAALTYIVLVVQASSFLLLFSPWRNSLLRTLGATLLILMQLGFLVSLRLSFFPVVSILGLLSFLPPALWTWCEKSVRRACLPLITPSAI